MPGRQAGFTLIEITIAVAIAATVMLTIYGVFSSVSSAKERVEEDSAAYHQARVLCDRIGKEVRGTYLRQENPKTLFVLDKNEDNLPRLTLSTTASTPQGGAGGIVIVRYDVRPDPDSDEGDRALFRSEYPLFFPEGTEHAFYRLASGIEDFQIRCFANGAWHEDWQQGLPHILEINFRLRLGNRTVPFTTAFELQGSQSRG